MKKLMMIAAMMVATLAVSAQNEQGQISIKPLVGINLANVSNIEGNKMKVGLAAGAEVEYGLAENIGISAGVLYSQEGCKGTAYAGGTTVDDVKFNMDYIDVPILVQYYPIKGLAVKAGVQPAFNVGHKAKKDGESADLTGVKKFQLGIPVGVSYEYQNIVLDARYNIGVTKIMDAVGGDKSARGNVIQITLGYKFTL